MKAIEIDRLTSPELPLDMDGVKGFIAPEEGAGLYRAASEAASIGPCLEVGSYCGKSSVYLGSACKACGVVLFAVDHHRGSEEHQPGEGYHDPELFDAQSGAVDSFREFRRTLARAHLEDTVVPIVAPSALVARAWVAPLGLVFIDGGHSREAALGDYRAWAGHIAPGGLLAIHDIYATPEEGGQAPREIWELALASGLFEQAGRVGSLGLARRLGNA